MATFRRLKYKEYLEIQKARKKIGLPPVKMGYKNCLRCDKNFYSEDLKNQHNCDNCRGDDVITAERVTGRSRNNKKGEFDVEI